MEGDTDLLPVLTNLRSWLSRVRNVRTSTRTADTTPNLNAVPYRRAVLKSRMK